MTTNFLFIGHRGTRVKHDENTIRAFKKALESGANCIEFDIRKTKDEKIIVLHDSTLDRTTSGSGFIKNFTLNEILNFKTKIHHLKIPLLTDVFKIFKDRIKFMIELKEVDIKGRVLDLVNEFNLLEDCIFSGRNLSVLANIKSTYPQSKVCYNITRGVGLKISEFLNLNKAEKLKFKPDIINLRSNLVTNKFIEQCQIFCIKSLAWDFISYPKPLPTIKSIINMGIDGILFDDHRNISKIKHWLG